MKKYYLFLFLAFTMGCTQDADEGVNEDIERDERKLLEFFAQNNINPNETSLGIFFEKIETNDLGNQITSGDIVGIYYEIRTIDGRLIDSYTDESRPPRLYIHEDGGTIPRAINFVSSFAKEGETVLLYAPAYLGYNDYNFGQLIQPEENLKIRIKFKKIYSEQEIQELEDQEITEHIAFNNLVGFEESESGLYLLEIAEGDTESPTAENGKIIRITYSISHLNEAQPVAQVSSQSNPFQVTIGDAQNVPFIEELLKGLSKDAEIRAIVPSHLAFGATTQVFPFETRSDLVQKGRLNQTVRPFEPIIFQAKVVDVR